MSNNRQMGINLANLEDFLCEECGCLDFVPVLRIKKLPALMSPDGTPGSVNLQYGFACTSCQRVYSIQEIANESVVEKKLIPHELKED